MSEAKEAVDSSLSEEGVRGLLVSLPLPLSWSGTSGGCVSCGVMEKGRGGKGLLRTEAMGFMGS